MSEYQYYEFVAIDAPISDEGLRYAEGCSSRASVSRVRWRNEYTYGDFRGSVATLLKYYDAHFYIANWGTVRFGLAFPKDALPLEAISPYLSDEDTLTIQHVGNRCVVWWKHNDDEGGRWIESEGLIDELIGVREELIRGDYRALFLGWLADFYPDGNWSPEGALVVPPVPAGINRLSPALEALIKHFPVDRDALAVVAELSQASIPDCVPMSEVLEKLSVSEMRALLARVAEGDGAKVATHLTRLTYPPVRIPVGKSMTDADLAAKTLVKRAERQQKEAEAAAAKQRLAAEVRQQQLASVMQRADTLWSSLDRLMNQKIASAYDQAAKQLQELSAAYAQAGDSGSFQEKLNGFRIRYSNRSAMLRRIQKLGEAPCGQGLLSGTSDASNPSGKIIRL